MGARRDSTRGIRDAPVDRGGGQARFPETGEVVSSIYTVMRVLSAACEFVLLYPMYSIGENVKVLVDRSDGSYCFRLHKDRVYYVRWDTHTYTTHTHTHTHTHACTHARTHAHMHTRTHSHVHTLVPSTYMNTCSCAQPLCLCGDTIGGQTQSQSRPRSP